MIILGLFTHVALAGGRSAVSAKSANGAVGCGESGRKVARPGASSRLVSLFEINGIAMLS